MWKEHIAWLKWAILFCRRDLESLREGDWLNLREDLYEFIAGTSIPQPKSPFWAMVLPPLEKPKFVAAMTPEKVKDIQRALRTDVECIVNERSDSGMVNLTPKGIEFSFAWFGPETPFVQLVQERDERMASRLALGLHLVQGIVTRDQFRKCPPGCGNLFLIERKPRADRNYYCSPRCARNAASKAYRRNKKEELKSAERARSKKRYRIKALKNRK
jgi:hypothetical protein